MSLKKIPLPLLSLSLQSFSNNILTEWKESYFNNNYDVFSKEIKIKFNMKYFPHSLYEQLFNHLVDTHARYIQHNVGNDDVPRITWLINSFFIENLYRLRLNSLRFIGSVSDEELNHLEYILISELPNMINLTEISLLTCNVDSTLPICNDEIMEKIGASCPNLRSLDISYNHKVTDVGLEYLVPNNNQIGCPVLTKVMLFGCTVTVEGVTVLVIGLPRLKYLGFRETGQCLMMLYKLDCNRPEVELELAHVNNLGVSDRTYKELRKLRCDSKMINAVSTLCPKLTGLKVRVTDSDLKYLHQLNNVCILELVFNIAKPSNPGSETIKYLNNNGTQLISLAFVCDSFSTQDLKVVGEQCTNLKRLWVRCYKFNSEEITKSDKKKCSLMNLEVFNFRVGGAGSEMCKISHNIMNYILHKSNCLKEIVLTMKNSSFSDSYIEEMLTPINTSTIKQLLIQVPFQNSAPSNNLSMMSVETIISNCPQLEELGNLLVWDISLEEVQELRRQLILTNSALILVYRMMYS